MVLSSAVLDVSTGAGQRVSVILPTYNRAVFLPDAFASVVAQSYLNLELIVVDDGSTDDSPAVLDRLASAYGRPLKIVRQPNAGAYAARNTGLDHATGDMVAFFDSDDLWLRTCALYVVGIRRQRSLLSRVEANLESADARVSETAAWARLTLTAS